MGDLARYIRVCALVEIPYSRLNSEQTHQCAIGECFAICVLERISRPHADGLYEWENSLGKGRWGNFNDARDEVGVGDLHGVRFRFLLFALRQGRGAIMGRTGSRAQRGA